MKRTPPLIGGALQIYARYPAGCVSAKASRVLACDNKHVDKHANGAASFGHCRAGALAVTGDD